MKQSFLVCCSQQVSGINIPKGYKNGADIPHIFLVIASTFKPKYLDAIVLHGYLCDNAKSKAEYRTADILLKSSMENLWANKLTVFYFYKLILMRRFLIYLIRILTGGQLAKENRAIMARDLYLSARDRDDQLKQKRRRDKTDANEYIKLSKIDDIIRYQLIFF